MPGILLFHKPKGVVVSRRDERGRKTVYDLLPDWVYDQGWKPVGRLDRDSRGLLLFVQDGKLLERLTRPGACLKTYEVWVRGFVTPELIERALEGVPAPAGRLRARKIIVQGGAGPKTRLRVVLDEGKNRHLRRLFHAFNDPRRGTPLKVVDLKRLEFGAVRLDVASGEWRFLTPKEVQDLISAS